MQIETYTERMQYRGLIKLSCAKEAKKTRESDDGHQQWAHTTREIIKKWFMNSGGGGGTSATPGCELSSEYFQFKLRKNYESHK